MVIRQSTWPISNRHGIDLSLRPISSHENPARPAPNLVRSRSRDDLRRVPNAEPSAAEPPQDVTREGIATWRTQVQKLTKVERDAFLRHSAADVQQYAAAIKEAAKEQAANSKAVKIAKLVKPLFETMNLYAPIAQTMIQADPTSSSLILGGITCVMSISTRFLDYQEKLGEMLSEMLEELEILLEYGKGVYRNNAEVQEALMDIYGDILQFCIEASKLFLDDKGKERSMTKTFLSSLRHSFDSRFRDQIIKFKRHLELFNKKAQLADRKRDDSDRDVQIKFMRRQDFEANQIYMGVVSVEQAMNAESRRRQIQEEERRMAETRKIRERRQRVLEWLPSVSFKKVQDDKFERRIDGTGQWLLENETFKSWRAKREPQLIWIHGKHGCGKSHLAARLIKELDDYAQNANNQKRDSKDIVALAYIYCGSLDPDPASTDPTMLLGSILKQLYSQLPHSEYDSSLEKLFDRQSEPPSRQEMKKAIMATIAKFSEAFIVVDGLDECHKLKEGQFGHFCEFVSSLVKPGLTNSLPKVVVFSRPEYQEAKDAFAECARIQVDAGGNDSDIKKFIARKASELKKDPVILEELKEMLLSRADGMFLWVALLVQTLKDERSTKKMKAAVNSLPQELDKVYELSMERVLSQSPSVRERALKILLWTTNAKRALSQSELLEALAIEPEMTELDDESILDDDGRFAAECGDLVVLVDGHYHLLHSSLKDYLKGLLSSKNGPLEKYRVMQAEAAKLLGETCLTYLNFEIFKSGAMESLDDLIKMQKDHPFLQYASTYWGKHVAEVEGDDLQELTLSFLMSDGTRELSMQNLMQSKGEIVCPYPGKTTPLHLLAIFNLVGITDALSNFQNQASEPDGFQNTPLDYALVEDCREMCTWLLEKYSTTSTEPAKPLEFRCLPVHIAASNDWGDIVTRLVALGLDKESKVGDRNQTPLHFAAIQGAETALKALLDAKVDVNTIDADGQTPLIDAAENNHPKIMMTLLEAGADVKVLGWNGATALHHVAKGGDIKTAKILLQKGAEVDIHCAKGWGFRTPLHLAVEGNSREVLELLIGKGADIEGIGPEGYNALLIACADGMSKCLEILLKAGAKTEVRNDDKQTGFHLSSRNGHSAILKMLLEMRPSEEVINSGDSWKDTPLHNAIWKGNKAEAKMLLDYGVRTDILNSVGNSPLHVAITEGELEIGKMLIHEYKADPKLTGYLGATAIHYAASYGRSEFVPMLLTADVNPEALNESSNTALHFATMENKLDFMKKFIDAVPGLELSPRNNKGKNPLHEAAARGFSEMVKFFLDQRASCIQTKDNDSNLPLHLAAWDGSLECLKLLLTKENIDDGGFFGRTALFGASSRGHASCVEFLLKEGADRNKTDNYQQTPLYGTLLSKHVNIANMLLDSGANPKVPTKYGHTALHEAAAIGQKALVIRLLGADCDALHPAKWVAGMTPFTRAVAASKVEIIDLFLERGFNGTSIPDGTGKTCIHIAAEIGSREILDKLTAEDKELALVLDYIGRDALNFAAGNGQVDMIGPLNELGISPNGMEKGIRRPIRDAASLGYYDFVNQLIELGAVVDKQAGPEQWSALHYATAYRRPLITERLLKAGADPTVRDSFGLCPLDYAFMDGQVWKAMGDWIHNYKPVDPTSKMQVLRSTIQKCVKNILALPQTPEYPSPKTEFERLENLEVLATALAFMGTKNSIQDSRISYMELASPPEFSNFELPFSCDICQTSPLRGTRYMCSVCTSCCLCKDCHEDYLKGGDTPKSLPAGLKALEKLETDLKPIRNVADPLRHFGGSLLLSSFDMLKVVIEWVNEKLKAYEEWEKTHNKSNRFDVNKLPGRQLLKLVEKARKLNKAHEEAKAKGNANDDVDPFVSITEGFSALCNNYKPDREILYFVCSGHDYMEIQTTTTMTDDDKALFNSDGKLTTEYLRSVLEKYSHVWTEGETNDIKEDGKKISAEQTLEMGDSNESRQTNQPESTGNHGNAVLSDLLTEEPMDVEDTVNKVKTEILGNQIAGNKEIDNKAPELEAHVDVQNQNRNGKKSDDKKTAFTHPTPHYEESISDYIMRIINNSTRLENIAKELESDVLSIYKVQAKFWTNVVQIADGNTGNNEGVTLYLAKLLLEREIAWQLAQVILFGFTGNSLTQRVEAKLEIAQETPNNEIRPVVGNETVQERRVDDVTDANEERQVLSGAYGQQQGGTKVEAATESSSLTMEVKGGGETAQPSEEKSKNPATIEEGISGRSLPHRTDSIRDDSTTATDLGISANVLQAIPTTVPGEVIISAAQKLRRSQTMAARSDPSSETDQGWEEKPRKKDDTTDDTETEPQTEKADTKLVPEPLQINEDPAVLQDRYKPYRQASIDSLPPSPLKRMSTDLLAIASRQGSINSLPSSPLKRMGTNLLARAKVIEG